MRQVYSFIMALVVSTIAMSANAQVYKSVVVDMTDGSRTVITLEKGMKTEFGIVNVVFISPSGDNVEIAKDNFVSMSFADPSGINGVVSDNPAPEYIDGQLSFNGLPAGSRVDVFDAAGRTVRHAEVSGDYTLSLSGLTPGIYIVTVNGINYKVSVK